MVWLKTSDNAAMHPVVLAPLAAPAWPEGDLDAMDIVNLLYGLVSRCATHSAGFLTDGVVSDGTVAMMGGRHWQHWAQEAAQAGYWTRVEVDGRPGWQILDDSTNFVHIRRKAEVEWERQRRRDASDSGLIVPVRLRDGDACRYCGVIVNWRDRKSGRGGTYDHRTAGQAARNPDDLRVACNACNGFRSNNPDADERRPPRPAPAEPFYGPETVALLAKHGHLVPASDRPRPGTQPGTAPRDPAPSRTPPPATPPPAGHRAVPTPPPPRPSDPAPSRIPRSATPPPAGPRHQDQPPRSADPADRRHAGSGSPGRDGTGSGREHRPPAPAVPAQPRRNRGRRSRRRPRKNTDEEPP